MNPDPKTRDPKKPANADDSFSDLDKLDRPELDEEADWENETGVRRVKTKPPPPMKLAGSA
jgi:hypothetical protein